MYQEKLKAWMAISAVLESLTPGTEVKNLTPEMIHHARTGLLLWGAELEEQTKHLEPEEMADEKR